LSQINLKELVLGTLATVFNVVVFWFWFRAAPLIAAGEFQNYSNFIIPAAGLIITASLFTLAALFIENKWLTVGYTFLGFGVPYLFIQANTTVVSLLIVTLALSAFAIYRLRREFNLSLGFSLSKTAKAGLPIYFSVASLIISIFYFTNIKEEKNISAILPKSTLNFAIKKLAGPLESLTGLPDLNPDATIDETLLKLLEKQIIVQGINMAKLPREELLRALSSQKEEFSKNFGIKLSGQEKIGDVLYKAISQKIEELLGPYKKYLPVASAIAFFLAFKTLTLPLYYLTILFTFCLIKIMIAGKILTKETKQIEVEKLRL